MKISMIAAMAKNRVIGKENQMPWHLPADFVWFKRCTLGKPVIMGRKTYDSIGRPLPGRQNIVISRDTSLKIEGVDCVSSIEEAIEMASDQNEIMIIGGGSIYQACLEKANCLYLTFIDLDVEGDTQFPDWKQGWRETYSESFVADEKNAHDMRFVVLER
ncbi:type 3 dihydrofolate reductase [Vibrio algarum]|uniref:Dihydrofolate reductase n=1 Tax=Vibrio algarum TaxID=3020714 RepID=A0ABT4YLH9_9VIBR|nr:type 3 dihydrofolate reductase [Vibrio sp. KJ40-1]MDB1122267.1 type 3 dihydrofolate reductase [Vibrio sp. KJ40-1]